MLGWWISGPLGVIATWPWAAYKSLKAIESEEKDDDTQWLIYWVIIGFLTIFETIFFFIIPLIPLYYELKLGLVIFLQIPNITSHGSGAQAVYDGLVKPQLTKHEGQVDKFLSSTFADVKNAKVFANLAPLMEDAKCSINQTMASWKAPPSPEHKKEE